MRGHTVALLVLLGLVGCAVEQGKVYVKDGRPYGVTSGEIWRSRWWNYYERGVSYADGEFWADAIADLQEAIKQRESDQRRARTYGLHFLDEYFPHRELGVIYYRLGRYPEAISELQSSLRHMESAKAKFYLNKARRVQLEQINNDTAPPRIVIESPQNGLLTRNFTATVRGYVEDDTYVSSITINRQKELIELAEPHLAFTREITLREGVNTIDIVAVDLVGKSTHQSLTVTLDRQGPLVSVGPVERLDPSASQRVRLEGTLTDSSGVVRFLLAGRQVPPQPGTNWDFREEVSLLPGMVVIPFEAEDAAGNITRGDIPLTLTESEVPAIQRGALPFLPRWASLAFGTVLADASSFAIVPRQVAQSEGAKPPVIKFRDPMQAIYAAAAPMRTTYDEAVYVEGQVVGLNPITLLTINGESLWRSEKPRIFFGYNATLQVGENRFVVESADKPGNQAKKELLVTRKLSTVQKREARLNVALSPLEKKGQVTALAETAYDYLLEAMVNQRRFQLVERDKLETILREQKITPLADPETAVKIGHITQAEGAIVGSVSETPHALTVLVRFVDVESSDILVATDVYGEDLSPPDVGELMTGLAAKVRQSFPLVRGLVLHAERNKIVVNLGSREIKKRMKLLVFRCAGSEGGTRASTGKDCEAETDVLDEVSIEAVFDDHAQGILRRGKTAVQEADSVITK